MNGGTVMQYFTLNNLLRAATMAVIIYFFIKILLLPYELYKVDKRVDEILKTKYPEIHRHN